jgi:hypothetical protein
MFTPKYTMANLVAYPWGCDLRLDVPSKAKVVEDIVTSTEPGTQAREEAIKAYADSLNYGVVTIKSWVKAFANTYITYKGALEGTILLSIDTVRHNNIEPVRVELAKLRAIAHKIISTNSVQPNGTGPNTRNMQNAANLHNEK